jgi:hypothetical protein
MIVPNSSAAIPKTGGELSGNHWVSVKKLAVLVVKDGIERQIRKTAIAAMMTNTAIPEFRLSPRKTRSPRRCALP